MIMETTIIAALSSTKNKDGERDPEMHQTKKGSQRDFGMRAHVGVDKKPMLVDHEACTAVNVEDAVQLQNLLHGKEDGVCKDSGDTRVRNREALEGMKAAFWITEKPSRLGAIKSKYERKSIERPKRFKASMRAKMEQLCRVAKLQSGYRRVRYRGFVKSAAEVLALLAPSYQWMARLAVYGWINPPERRGNLSNAAWNGDF